MSGTFPPVSRRALPGILAAVDELTKALTRPASDTPFVPPQWWGHIPDNFAPVPPDGRPPVPAYMIRTAILWVRLHFTAGDIDQSRLTIAACDLTDDQKEVIEDVWAIVDGVSPVLLARDERECQELADKLRRLGRRLMGDPPTNGTAPPLSVGDVGILEALKQVYPKLVDYYELESKTGQSRRTIGDRVNSLIKDGLVTRPKGPRMGATLTPAGLTAVAAIAH
jgi:hypothetical protein